MAERKTVEAPDDRVEVLIPLGTDLNEPNFITASCNGKVYKIMKGVPVKVPKEIKEIIDNAEAAKREALGYQRDRVQK